MTFCSSQHLKFRIKTGNLQFRGNPVIYVSLITHSHLSTQGKVWVGRWRWKNIDSENSHRPCSVTVLQIKSCSKADKILPPFFLLETNFGESLRQQHGSTALSGVGGAEQNIITQEKVNRYPRCRYFCRNCYCRLNNLRTWTFDHFLEFYKYIDISEIFLSFKSSEHHE